MYRAQRSAYRFSFFHIHFSVCDLTVRLVFLVNCCSLYGHLQTDLHSTRINVSFEFTFNFRFIRQMRNNSKPYTYWICWIPLRPRQMCWMLSAYESLLAKIPPHNHGAASNSALVDWATAATAHACAQHSQAPSKHTTFNWTTREEKGFKKPTRNAKFFS